MSELKEYKYQPNTKWIVDDVEIIPEEDNILRINAGRIASDNKINVVAHVFCTGKSGPTVLILGGIHGDEINGIEIVRRFVQTGLTNRLLLGNIIAIPLLNVYGFINQSRDVTDGKDLNRSFPGNVNGSLAARVARIISKKILPHVDMALDFHTGGGTRYNAPQVRYSKYNAMTKKMALRFGAKFIIEQPPINQSFRKAAAEMGIPSVVFEGGESIRIDEHVVGVGLTGIENVLREFGMIRKEQTYSDQYAINVQRDIWQRAAIPGLFVPTKFSGDLIKKGEQIGIIHDPYGTKSWPIASKYSGYIIGHNNNSVVNLGDPLFHIGYKHTLCDINESVEPVQFGF